MSALAVCAALAAGSCAKEVDDTSGEGCLRMTIDIDRLTRAETDAYDPTGEERVCASATRAES